ncbi:folate-binding protein YgfZ [Deinococcus deserti]|uniref:Putative Glycine cleavage T protein (Aminomethyltransferase) putative folate-binding protein YgfZ n=1 Tax=Deinococcus deserti (strain DSM 17065 / CIP 109153 / LMG 22923 / VCD115) TaxID=546414 RepID=C1CXI9_DEIDV|nr:folate-binding protein YgfZ [Deinococcus deserti]ACO46906.2 putative Glycine cleavage T protein (aminomethyltransferase); putative folate-binding protein YgfZ [Deinococcus deserti VCD115]
MWTFLPSSSLRITGADRVDFVHGQMTGDLRGAPTPGLVPCAFLNVRGQIEQFARAYRREQDIYLHLDAGQAPGLAARLKRYIIFDQVEVEDVTDTLRTVHVWDQAVPGWLTDGPAAQSLDLGGAVTLAGRVNRSGTSGVDLHYLARQEEDVLNALGGQEAPLDELETARVRAGIPDIVRDGFTGVLPQEVGLDLGGPLPAISYRKGCYVGQEIMARLEARGNTRYHLARLSGTDLPDHAEVTAEGKVVGQSGHFAGGLSLARLRKELPEGAQVQVGGHLATVQLLTLAAP